MKETTKFEVKARWRKKGCVSYAVTVDGKPGMSGACVGPNQSDLRYAAPPPDRLVTESECVLMLCVHYKLRPWRIFRTKFHYDRTGWAHFECVLDKDDWGWWLDG